MQEKKFFSTRNVTYLAVLSALVIMFQVLSGFMKIGATSFCLVLIPIVLGGIILGVKAGAFLGALFGIIVIIDALCGLDPFTLYLLNDQPIFTVILCLTKGVAAGVLSALAYKTALRFWGDTAATFVAAATAPVVNTGLFIVGALIMSGAVAGAFGSLNIDVSGASPFYIVIVMCVGVNFFVELALNLVLAPSTRAVARIVSTRNRSGK